MFNFYKILWSFAFAPLCFGGGGGSSASTSTTNNLDKRLVVSGGQGVTADNSTVNILDGGLVRSALDTVGLTNAMAAQTSDTAMRVGAGATKSALDAMTLSNAMSGTNYQNLLASTDAAFNRVSASAQASAQASAESARLASSTTLSALTALNGQNQVSFAGLLDATKSLFTSADKALSGGFASLAQSQNNAAAFVDTVNSKGTLDNRTITIIGVAAAAAIGLFAFRKG